MARKSVYDMSKAVSYAEQLMMAGTPLIIFDLETTGLNATTDRILSFSAIKVIYENGIGIVKDKKDIFINPGFHIPESASSVNHITDDVVADCPTEDEAVKEISEFLGEKPFLAGYNSTSFDIKFMKSMYQRTLGIDIDPIFHIDVMLMAKEKFEGSHKLCDIAEELGVAAGISFHASMDDVVATYRCFNLLRALYKEDEEIEYIPCTVSSARYWGGYNHSQSRIYVTTNPASKTYYSSYSKEWLSDMDFDLGFVRDEVLKKYNVADEKALLAKLKN